MRRIRKPTGVGSLRVVVLGFIDGVLNALGLAAGSILRGVSGVDTGLALRIGGFAFATGLFVLFVSDYVALRSGLVRAARQLNLTEHGRLATTRLGATIRGEAALDALMGGATAFVGSVIPLLVAALAPRYSWAAIVVALGMLAALGATLARTVYGNPVLWAVTLALGGAVLTAAGANLRIV